jgi:hypothetical protein
VGSRRVRSRAARLRRNKTVPLHSNTARRRSPPALAGSGSGSGARLAEAHPHPFRHHRVAFSSASCRPVIPFLALIPTPQPDCTEGAFCMVIPSSVRFRSGVRPATVPAHPSSSRSTSGSFIAAAISGVPPSSAARLGSAPASSSSRATSSLPQSPGGGPPPPPPRLRPRGVRVGPGRQQPHRCHRVALIHRCQQNSAAQNLLY